MGMKRLCRIFPRPFERWPLPVVSSTSSTLARCDETTLTVTRCDTNAVVQVDDILSARRRVPIQIVLGPSFPEDDPGGGQALRQLAPTSLFGPFDLNVTEV